MITVNFFQFLLNLILAGLVIRFAEMKLAGSSLGNALSFIY